MVVQHAAAVHLAGTEEAASASGVQAAQAPARSSAAAIDRPAPLRLTSLCLPSACPPPLPVPLVRAASRPPTLWAACQGTSWGTGLPSVRTSSGIVPCERCRWLDRGGRGTLREMWLEMSRETAGQALLQHSSAAPNDPRSAQTPQPPAGSAHMWPPPPSRSPCLARLLLAAALAAALLAAGCSALGEHNDSSGAAAAAPATHTAAPLHAKDEQDLLKWALCECACSVAARASGHGQMQPQPSQPRRHPCLARRNRRPTAAPPSPRPPHPAAAHSDPDALKAAAAEARAASEAGSPEFRERQQRVQALLDAMREEPTESELMQVRPAAAGCLACCGPGVVLPPELLLGERYMLPGAAAPSCGATRAPAAPARRCVPVYTHPPSSLPHPPLHQQTNKPN